MIASPLTVDVRRGAIAGLRQLLAEGGISSGGRVAVLVGPGQGEAIAEGLAPTVSDADVLPVGAASIDAARELSVQLRQSSYDAVVGIGGGRTLDVAKYTASLTGLPMVAVATNLSHDGIASPVASLEHEGRKGSYGVHIPLAVFVDLDYVERAPARMVRSGIGDVVSNLSALSDWRVAGRERGGGRGGAGAGVARGGRAREADGRAGRGDGPGSCGRGRVPARLDRVDRLPGHPRRGAGPVRPRDGSGGQQPAVQRGGPRDPARDRPALPRCQQPRRARRCRRAVLRVPPW